MNYSKVPLRLQENRVRRTYCGGQLLETWMNQKNPTDGMKPEEWVFSDVEAKNSDFIPGEGLSAVSVNGRTLALGALIQDEKTSYLGENRMDAGVLIKLLDAGERLTIQVHPTKAYAREFLHSQYGKTECWYVLDVRNTDGGEPFVLFGFKENVTRELWKSLFEKQDISGMLACLHKFRARPGEVYLINGGIPHAIGNGCFLAEIQEPTDYTMRVEKTTPQGHKIADMLIHQGVGEEKMLDAFDYTPMSREEIEKKYKLVPKVLHKGENYKLEQLVGYEDTECFRVLKIEVKTEAVIPVESFLVIIVLEGDGAVRTDEASERARKGDRFFIPHAAKRITIENITALICYPPATEITNIG